MFSSLCAACLRRNRVAKLPRCSARLANGWPVTESPCFESAAQGIAEQKSRSGASRHIGTLPGLSIQGFFAESPAEQLTRHTERKITPVPPDVFFDVVSDVDQYTNFLPFCIHSKVLRRLSDNVIVAEMGIGFRVFEERYVSHITLDRERRKIHIKAIESPTFSKLNSFWEFGDVPGKPGHTQVNFSVEFGFVSPIMSQAIRMVLNDVSKLQVRAFEARCLKIVSKEAEAAAKAAVESSGPSAVDEEGHAAFGRPMQVKLADGEQKDTNREAELSAIASSLAQSAPRPVLDDEPVVTALLLNHDGCLVDACMRLAKLQGGLSCSRGFALLAADAELREAVTVGLHWLLLREKTLNGRSRVETLARALRLLLMKRDASRNRAELMFFMADMNRNGAISKDELRCMLESHIRIVDAAVPWLVQKSIGNDRVSPEDLNHLTQQVLAQMRPEITKDAPGAVERIFLEFDGNKDGALVLGEWQAACVSYPELVDLLNLQGVSQMVHMATSSPRLAA